MYQMLKTLRILAGLTFSALWMGTVFASAPVTNNIVSFSQASYGVTAGDSLTVNVVGSNFDVAPNAASFSLNWDPAVLTYVSTSVITPPWNPLGNGSFVSTDNAATGNLDYAFLTMDSGNAGSNFGLASFTFNVLVNAPIGGSLLTLNNDLYNIGFLNGLNSINVNYVGSQVQVVPVPAAAWLFGTGLVGLLGLKKRSQT